jgi:hypothetical protein
VRRWSWVAGGMEESAIAAVLQLESLDAAVPTTEISRGSGWSKRGCSWALGDCCRAKNRREATGGGGIEGRGRGELMRWRKEM